MIVVVKLTFKWKILLKYLPKQDFDNIMKEWKY